VKTSSTVEQIVIRKCKGTEEFNACVDLQKDVWKFADAELVPMHLFVVAEEIGGQVIGAFDDRELVGFVLSFPGARPYTRGPRSYLHSHLLAVRENYRNLHLGRRLKLAQRQDAIDRGFELIEWTFDPLEIKNAYLNIVKLGAIVRRYSVNHYGDSSSPLHRGLPTDRIIAEWWLKSNRVTNLLESGEQPSFQAVQQINVPAQIYSWRSSETNLPQATEIQTRNREEFLQAFSRGLAVLGYNRDEASNGSYLLGSWDEKWSYASEELR
jgi:predicted GNAT superfamily acetyltransferase